MTRPFLEKGSKGPYVKELQELLIKWFKKTDPTDPEPLVADSDFGNKTRDRVKSYQRSVFLVKDGKVGNMTWSALLGIEMYNSFDLPSTFVRAPDKFRCWAGATAMLLKRAGPIGSVAGVDFETQPNGLVGGVENSHENMQKFANALNIQMFKAENLSGLQLTNLVDQFGRLMLNIKGVNSNMKSASPDDSHLCNLVGVRGDGTSKGTTMTIYNPSGDVGDMVITHSHHYWKSKYPKLTYQVFYSFANSSSPIVYG